MSDNKGIALWRYKSVLIEFQKDGLLGEKYIDEEEVEAVLNELGLQGWELTTATLVPEGLLLCCKQALPLGAEQAIGKNTEVPGAKPEAGKANPVGDIKIF